MSRFNRPVTLMGLLALTGVLAAPRDAGAAQIYGSINRPNTAVHIQCESGATADTRTDAQGRYQVFIGLTGRCTLTLPEQGGAHATVYSYDQPARFDFDVVEGSDQLRGR